MVEKNKIKMRINNSWIREEICRLYANPRILSSSKSYGICDDDGVMGQWQRQGDIIMYYIFPTSLFSTYFGKRGTANE